MVTTRSEANVIPYLVDEPGPVLWAIDPENGIAPDALALRYLISCSGGDYARIRPIYVTAPVAGVEADRLRSQARHYVTAIGGEGFAPADILMASASDYNHAVNRLVEEATNHGASLIAVASHGRSGPRRWFHGGFAEKLLARSPVPVLFLPHRADYPPCSERRVLCSTDFTEHSQAAFRRLCRFAARSPWRIVLFHDVALPISAACDLGSTSVAACLPPHYYRDQRAWAEEQSLGWLEEARNRDVEVDFQVAIGGPDPVASVILDYADRNAVTSIALSTSEHPISRWLLGSTAREVFRANLYPVWVYGPRAS